MPTVDLIKHVLSLDFDSLLFGHVLKVGKLAARKTFRAPLEGPTGITREDRTGLACQLL